MNVAGSRLLKRLRFEYEQVPRFADGSSPSTSRFSHTPEWHGDGFLLLEQKCGKRVSRILSEAVKQHAASLQGTLELFYPL